jgi:dihydroorotate dehydrogenase
MKLATTYLGLKLRTPLVPSASPLSERLDNIKRMEDACAAAVVFHSPAEAPSGPRYAAILGRTPRWICGRQTVSASRCCSSSKL